MSIISNTLEEAREKLKDVSSLAALQDFETSVVGKQGSLTSLLKSIKDVAPEERKSFGQAVNAAKVELEKLIEEKRELFLEEELSRPVSFDTTLPGHSPKRGSLHPIAQVEDELNEAFHSLGFDIFRGPEISTEAFAFDNLNFPAAHSARESMDTYWLDQEDGVSGAKRLCLRPHLTGASVRYMKQNKPPFRFVYPGRVFRSESTDASHERTFTQYEALIVDKKVPFSAGRLLVNTILECVFGQKVKTRMRAGFFPFVEPGFEIDMQCLVCQGKGCSVCGQVGWVEMMPGGPPHPNVLKAGGVDPNEWQGFYINIGLDRITMMRHSIDDIRLFRSTDIRFLSQFDS